MTGSAEVIFPVPFFSDFKSVRVSGFVDGGNVFGPGEDFEHGNLRYSAGLSGIWVSPFGVVSASIAMPINDQENDKTQPFQFNFGTSF